MPATRRRRVAALALCTGLALLTAACGDDDDAADDPTVQDDDPTTEDGVDAGEGEGEDEEAAAAQEDVCELVSTDELQTLFGSPFDPGELTHQEQTSGDQCTWSNTDAPPVKVVSVVVYVDEGLQDAFGQSAEAFFELNRDAVTIDEELDLGDEAFRSGSMVWIRDGDRLVNVTITGTSDEAIEGLRGLAELVAEA